MPPWYLLGKEYVFVDRVKFEHAVANMKMMEWGQKGQFLYGTPKLLNSDLGPEALVRAAQVPFARPSLQDVVSGETSGLKEASLQQVLEKSGVELAGIGNSTPSEYLWGDAADPNNPTAIEIRERIRSAMHVLTVPFTTRQPKPGETHGSLACGLV